ncbi:MAG: acyl-CoA dehydrogenase family protein [Pseudomonadota bacterium]
MIFESTDEQRLLGDTVDRFARSRYSDGQRHGYLSAASGFDDVGWRIMADIGLLALPFSEQFGGLDGTPGDIISLMRPLGRHLAAEPTLGGLILAGSLLDRAGTTTQLAEWAPRIIDGTAHLAVAHAEKAARFRLGHVDTRFVETTDGATLTGAKTFVIAAGAADAFIVSAIPQSWSPNGTTRANAMRLFLVDAGATGISRRDYRLTDGSVACELDLTEVTAAPMQGNFEALKSVVALGKIAACAEMVGAMEMLFDATLDYLKARKQFGKPIGTFQAIQHRAADHYTALEFSKSHLYRLARVDTDDADGQRVVAGTKAFISEAAIALAEDAVQMHGAMGTTNELPVGDGLKRIMLLSSLFGDVSAELSLYA